MVISFIPSLNHHQVFESARILGNSLFVIAGVKIQGINKSINIRQEKRRTGKATWVILQSSQTLVGCQGGS